MTSAETGGQWRPDKNHVGAGYALWNGSLLMPVAWPLELAERWCETLNADHKGAAAAGGLLAALRDALEHRTWDEDCAGCDRVQTLARAAIAAAEAAGVATLPGVTHAAEIRMNQALTPEGHKAAGDLATRYFGLDEAQP